MIVPINIQVNLIVYSILAGVLTGILFDIYRIIRGFENPNIIITLIEDMLFWIFSAMVVFIFLLYNSYIYIGGYLFLYIALGLYVYLKLLSSEFLKIEYNVVIISSRIFRIIKNIAIYPLELIIYNIINKNKQK